MSRRKWSRVPWITEGIFPLQASANMTVFTYVLMRPSAVAGVRRVRNIEVCFSNGVLICPPVDDFASSRCLLWYVVVLPEGQNADFANVNWAIPWLEEDGYAVMVNNKEMFVGGGTTVPGETTRKCFSKEHTVQQGDRLMLVVGTPGVGGTPPYPGMRFMCHVTYDVCYQ